MTLRTAGGQQTAETAQDLQEWLRGLQGCPAVARTKRARCHRPAHGDEPGSWFYVEADPHAGVARLRCLGCGDVRPVLDSADRWTFPAAWACANCNQPIGEVAFGVDEADGVATWVAVGVRCVECGHLQGVADFVVAPTDVDELAASL